MIIYEQELEDGLSDHILASSSIAYASIAQPSDKEARNLQIKNSKTLASLSDADLYYVQSILVSSSWNKNDDIFDKAEVWQARNTPEDKPTNLEHDENLIIGHITANWPIDDTGDPIDENISLDNLPEKFHILTGSVIYRAFTDPTLKERAEKLISEIENGTKYVSMECYFNGFDYGLINKVTNTYKVLSRNNNTAYLTKHLRAYGGTGEHQDYKIGRVLRNITFSGKGFVDKPANPDSVIFTKENIFNLLDKKNDNLTNSGVILNKSTSNVENIIMNENLEKQVAELGTKIDTVSANCADTVKEAYATASELKEANQILEAAVKTQEEEVKKMKAAKEDMEEEAKKAKSAFETELEAAAKKWSDEKALMEEEMKKAKSELEEANEILAGYKAKEAEMVKKEKNIKRMASLITAGLDNDAAAAAVEKFDHIDDESFEAMTSILAAVKPAVKKEEEAMMMKPSKKMASEEALSALEEVEVEETVELSVGDDETESQADSIRAELVEFVSARLSKNSK
jgi:hypothetical protein